MPSASGTSSSVTVRPFESRDAPLFRDLNLAWIEEHFAVEDSDRRDLGRPEEAILDRGGAILVAEDAERVLGVCALRNEGNDRYELTKMAVHEDARGRGIGRRLLEGVIAQARKMGAKELYLVSNTVLGPAIHLYRDLGFVEVPIPSDVGYARANIAMEMPLEPRRRDDVEPC